MTTTLITKQDSNDIYHSHKSISASGLKTIYKKSVKHYLRSNFKETPAMALGTAVHTIMLEGQKQFDKDYYLMPKYDGRTKEGKQIKAKHEKLAGDRKQLRDTDMDIISGIMQNLKQHDLAQKYCTGTVELSHYGKMNGIPIRVRPDVFGDDWIGDVKTCQDNSPTAFRRDVFKYAYHLQACFYSDVLGFPPENFRFVAVETNYPFTVEVYALDDTMIALGREAYEKALSDWGFYLTTGIEKGYQAAGYTDDGSLIL
jgi:exodeoxyribonuclease VIII